jgi:hypothetical protein
MKKYFSLQKIISKFMNRLFLLLSFSFFLLPEAFSKVNLDNDTVKVNNQVYYVIKNKRGKYVDDYGIARRTDGKVDTLFTSPMYLFGIEKQKNGILFFTSQPYTGDYYAIRHYPERYSSFYHTLKYPEKYYLSCFNELFLFKNNRITAIQKRSKINPHEKCDVVEFTIKLSDVFCLGGGAVHTAKYKIKDGNFVLSELDAKDSISNDKSLKNLPRIIKSSDVKKLMKNIEPSTDGMPESLKEIGIDSLDIANYKEFYLEKLRDKESKEFHKTKFLFHFGKRPTVDELYQYADSLYSMPSDFVNLALFGSFIISTSYTYVGIDFKLSNGEKIKLYSRGNDKDNYLDAPFLIQIGKLMYSVKSIEFYNKLHEMTNNSLICKDEKISKGKFLTKLLAMYISYKKMEAAEQKDNEEKGK